MNSKTPDDTSLERERKNLHTLIGRNKEQPLSSKDLVEQSRKLDDLIVLVQQDRKPKRV